MGLWSREACVERGLLLHPVGERARFCGYWRGPEDQSINSNWKKIHFVKMVSVLLFLASVRDGSSVDETGVSSASSPIMSVGPIGHHRRSMKRLDALQFLTERR